MRKKIFLSLMMLLLALAWAIPGSARAQRTNKSNDHAEKKDVDSENVALNSKLQELTEQISGGLSEGKKKKIAVIEFSDLEGRVTVLGKFISEELITRLFMTKKYEVVERLLLNKVVEENKLTLTGLVDQKSAEELGKILGVDAICSGTITDLVHSVKLNARLISTETGSVFAVATVQIEKDETITKLMAQKYVTSSSGPVGKNVKTSEATAGQESTSIVVDPDKLVYDSPLLQVYFEEFRVTPAGTAMVYVVYRNKTKVNPEDKNSENGGREDPKKRQDRCIRITAENEKSSGSKSSNNWKTTLNDDEDLKYVLTDAGALQSKEGLLLDPQGSAKVVFTFKRETPDSDPVTVNTNKKFFMSSAQYLVFFVPGHEGNYNYPKTKGSISVAIRDMSAQ